VTYAPKTLSALATFWMSKHGVNLGIVGNAAHTQGYHLGRDRIYDGSGPGIGASDYSVQQARDKAGLTDAASAIDLGRLNQSLGSLYAFSRWLVRQCEAQAPGTDDIREVIYSPDGALVQRWSGVDNAIHTGLGNGDSSHLGHTHISYFRDSETRDKVAVFALYFAAPMPDTSTGGDPMGLHVTLPATPAVGTLAIPAGTDAIRVADGQHYRVPTSVKRDAYVAALTGPNSGPGWLVDLNGDEAHFVRPEPGTVFTPAEDAAYNLALVVATAAITAIPRR
jgi:hypothetical protein